MASFLPEELCVEILKRVEGVSLLRFRCVCKSWNSLISSSSFINTHHLSFINNPNHKSYFLYVFNRCSNLETSYAFYNPPQDDDQSPLYAEDLIFKRLPFEQPLHIVDVIHGVVCLTSQKDTDVCTRVPDVSILWNPTIHKHVQIPSLDHSGGGLYSSYLGFGFDARKNDFKVVRIFGELGCPWRIEVFSTLEGRLRSLAVDAGGPIDRCSWPAMAYQGCFINRSIHWIVCIGEKRAMLVFNCESEEFKTMELPQELTPQKLNLLRHPTLRVFNTYHGMLSVWCTYTRLWSGFWGVEAWVMEEYGVASSWKKPTPQQLFRFVTIQQRSQIKDPSIINGNVFKPSMYLMDARQDPYASTFI